MTKKILNVARIVLLLAAAAGAVSYATIVGSLPYTLTNGATADASQVMANYNKIITDVNANAAHNGVNADITALTALSTPITIAQGGTTWYNGGTSTGSANAHTVASVVPTGMTLAAGQGICFNSGFTNTGPTTLVANGLTAKNVFRQSPSGNQALTGGEMVASSFTCAQYDGTQYILRTSSYLAPGIGPATNLTAAATADLGTIPSHNVTITGNTGITAFGSSASATYPVYNLKFTGTPTLTYNATSLITPGARTIQAAANDTAVALYLGSGNWQILNFTPAIAPPGSAFGIGTASSVVITNNAATPNSKVDIAAGSFLMVDTSGYAKFATGVGTITIDAGTVGANGIDAGSLANSTWYYEWVISNGSATAGLLSTSASAPTMPTGYVYKTRVGEIRTNGSAQFFRVRQIGRFVRFQVTAGGTTVALPQLVSPLANQTRTAAPWAACAPPEAAMLSLVASVANVNNTVLNIAPNSDAGYAATFSITAPAPFSTQQNTSPNTWVTTVVDILPESANVYYSTGNSGASDSINCYGWTSASNVS